MKTVIHVNQHIIKANAKSSERNPVLTVRTARSQQELSTHLTNRLVVGLRSGLKQQTKLKLYNYGSTRTS
jgi:hypothetical protein